MPTLSRQDVTVARGQHHGQARVAAGLPSRIQVGIVTPCGAEPLDRLLQWPPAPSARGGQTPGEATTAAPRRVPYSAGAADQQLAA